MEMMKVNSRSFPQPIAIEEEEYKPTIHFSDVPIPADAKVGDEITVHLVGKVVGISESKHYSSLEVEMDEIGYADVGGNEFSKMAEEDETDS